jgi:hypothetical protein
VFVSVPHRRYRAATMSRSLYDRLWWKAHRQVRVFTRFRYCQLKHGFEWLPFAPHCYFDCPYCEADLGERVSPGQ